MDYEVYVCKRGAKIIYVGSGVVGRNKHCNSGRSHVYELNKLHFEGEVFKVDITYYETREEALEKEITLIQELSPIYNTQYTKRDNRRNLGSEKIAFRKSLNHHYRMTKVHLRDDKFLKLSEELLRCHTMQEIQEEGIIIKYPVFYYNLGCNTFGNMVKRSRVFTIKTSVEFFKVLDKTYKEFYSTEEGIEFEGTNGTMDLEK